jgi:hypothetical protein
MDGAVGIVQAWLRLRGYFTVTEYPIVDAWRFGGPRTLTDLDVLAFRFPGAGAPDLPLHPVLDAAGRPDMLIGEVKEGRAELNHAARDPAVLAAALARFGCCGPDHVEPLVGELVATGRAVTHAGHLVRLVAFGSTGHDPPDGSYRVVLLGHLLRDLHAYVRENWDVLVASPPKDAALNQIVIEEKALRGLSERRS